MSVIRVENLGKKYIIGANGAGSDGLRHAIHDLFTNPLRKRRNGHSQTNPQSAISNPQSAESAISNQQSEEFWALKDVSFEVQQGEVVGIIGRNGAGKSTLLKILSRITEPTTGRLGIRGRVASLLEVGTGFHPELTGRENVFLNGAILGMTRDEIKRKFDEIVAFAEIEKFIDTPVKRYSSGMYVRLAFAVAAHLEPEILIVDEVLAVGDTQFQKKCIGKMGEVGKQGRTVLFVSHNLQVVSTLTSRAVLLEAGRVKMQGLSNQVIEAYLAGDDLADSCYSASPSTEKPNITKASVCTSAPNSHHVHAEPLEFRFEISTPRAIKNATFSFQIVDALGQPIVHMSLVDSDQPFCRSAGIYELRCVLPKARLYMGRYMLTTYLSEGPGGNHFETLEGVCPFEVVMHGLIREWPWQPGACRYLEEGTWSIVAGSTANLG